MSLFVTAAGGTERALKEELRALRVYGVKGDRGGVHVEGDVDVAARICLGSRVAVRVLLEVGRFACRDERALYEGVGAIAWERWITPDHTIAVTAVSRASRLHHTRFLAQHTKDAIVDRQRRQVGARSSVDRKDPDLGVFVHLVKDRAGVFLDVSGGPLHQRGWRAEGGEAPLKETLAAALVRLSGWDRRVPLIDPMCGSGTLPIEADLTARRIPPHANTRRFGFERWRDHDGDAARRLVERRAELAGAARTEGPECLGMDREASAVAIATENAQRAGSRARFSIAALEDLAPSTPSHVLTNPPYGVRLDADEGSWRELADALARLEGHTVSVLVPDEAPRWIAPRDARTHPVFNGTLRCHLVTWTPDRPTTKR